MRRPASGLALRAKGVEFMGEPTKMAWGTYVLFSDTDGNQFLLRGT